MWGVAADLLGSILRRNPNEAVAWNSVAALAIDRQEIDAALVASENAIKMIDHPAVHITRACSLFKAGRWTEGYDHFDKRKLWILPREAPFGEWDGKEPCKLLVVHEQGYGDLFMMARYFPLLREQGCEVSCLVPDSAAEVIASIEGVDKVCSPKEPVPDDCDAYLFAFDLMRHFEVMPDTILWRGPYLGPWKDPGNDKLRVGVCWAGGVAKGAGDGSPEHEAEVRTIGLRRSMPKAALWELLDARPDIDWISLQQYDHLPDSSLKLGPPLHTFKDTLDLILTLDVVVTVDTVVAHLAGAAGVPTLMLSRKDACWRWYPFKWTTPWYPSMRILYATRPHDWLPVIRRVKMLLAESGRAESVMEILENG
jgi:hypothetical protein